jgi:hypothetical protein
MAERTDSESFRQFGLDIAVEVMPSETRERFESKCEIMGRHEVGRPNLKLVVAVHAFDLAVGLQVFRLRASCLIRPFLVSPPR